MLVAYKTDWLTHSLQNRSTLVRVVLGRPTAACSYSDRHRVQCTTGLCSWPLPLSLIHRRFAVVDWRLWSVSSFCRRHSDLWVLLTNAVLVHGTTEPYFWVYWCRFRLDAITQAPAQHYKIRSSDASADTTTSSSWLRPNHTILPKNCRSTMELFLQISATAHLTASSWSCWRLTSSDHAPSFYLTALHDFISWS